VPFTLRVPRCDQGARAREIHFGAQVSRQTINSIETERNVPSLPLALAARYFGKSVEEIFGDENL
jgi:DNA-binding XRE family transcriptional regulator